MPRALVILLGAAAAVVVIAGLRVHGVVDRRCSRCSSS